MLKRTKKLLWVLVAVLVVGLFAPSIIASATPNNNDDFEEFETFQDCGGENNPTQ